jgi:hypothetical protein
LKTDLRARHSSGAGTCLRALICGGLGLLAALLTASCGNSTFTPGTPVATLTAEPGRFTSYLVYIDQIYFTRQDNSTATLPAVSQRVDLAHLSTNNNIFTLSPIEEGTYVSATFEINYSDAYITYEANGQAYTTSPVDPATGTTPGVVTVTVKFDPNHPLVIHSQTSTPVYFNIDLEASNVVTSSAPGVLQTIVKPFWTATTVPAYDKPLYARGLFVLADPKNSSFVMNTRPLNDLVNSPFGALTVNTTAQTYFQISGKTYIGADGLAALAALQNVYSNIQIAAIGPSSGNPFGSFANIQPSMSATQVYVGSSLESTIEEKVTGFVSAISGNTLTVQSATYVDHLGNQGFVNTLPVTVGPGTILSVDGVDITPTLGSVSIGQFVTILGVGTATTDGLGLATPTALDATSTIITGNQMRLQNSTFYGTVNSISAGTMSVNMAYIDNYEPIHVNFTGTGAAGGADATYTAYTVATGSLDVSAITAGELVKVDGLPTAFGSGPPYFNASAITPASQLDSQLILEWSGSGSASPFSSVSASGIVVNLADAGLPYGQAVIRTGPVTTQNLLSQPPPNPTQLTIAFNTSNTLKPPMFGVGSIAQGESLYSDPTAFTTQVQTLVNSTNPAYKLVATGQYDATTGTFTATGVSINVK